MTEYACLFLPAPPSTNNLFFNLAGRGRAKTRRYRDWQAEASIALGRQIPLPEFTGYVDLTISCEPGRGDISNRIKAVEDFIVSNGIIEDDNKVRRVTVEWHRHVVGCRVQIESVAALHVEDAAKTN